MWRERPRAGAAPDHRPCGRNGHRGGLLTWLRRPRWLGLGPDAGYPRRLPRVAPSERRRPPVWPPTFAKTVVEFGARQPKHAVPPGWQPLQRFAVLYGALCTGGRHLGAATALCSRVTFSLYLALFHGPQSRRGHWTGVGFGPNVVLFKHPRRDPACGIEISGWQSGHGLGYAALCDCRKQACASGSRCLLPLWRWRMQRGLGLGGCRACRGHMGLASLTVIVDVNGLQLDGPTAQILTRQPAERSSSAFGFEAIEVDRPRRAPSGACLRCLPYAVAGRACPPPPRGRASACRELRGVARHQQADRRVTYARAVRSQWEVGHV